MQGTNDTRWIKHAPLSIQFIMPQLGLDVGGNFDSHIWACSGNFIVRNRLTGTVMHTTKPRDKRMEYSITVI